jgi:hypothetical protein
LASNLSSSARQLGLKGKRFGNAFSEAGTKKVMDFQTKIEPAGNEFLVNGKKFYSTGKYQFFCVRVDFLLVNS